jgi:hypothetical protein
MPSPLADTFLLLILFLTDGLFLLSWYHDIIFAFADICLSLFFLLFFCLARFQWHLGGALLLAFVSIGRWSSVFF